VTPPDHQSEATLNVTSLQMRSIPALMSNAPRQTESSTAWMVTFTDLIALMLTFFVLLYSMSKLDIVQWQNLTGTALVSLDSVSDTASVKPKAQLDIAPVSFVPGSDLDYLANVLSERLRSDNLLSQARFRNAGDRLIVSLPDALLFEEAGADGGSAVLGARAEQTMFALGGVFRTIGNTIEIVSYPVDTSDNAGNTEAVWTDALSRAIALSRLLKDSGYTGIIHPRGVAWAQPEPDSQAVEGEAAFDRRVDVIVLDSAGER